MSPSPEIQYLVAAARVKRIGVMINKHIILEGGNKAECGTARSSQFHSETHEDMNVSWRHFSGRIRAI